MLAIEDLGQTSLRDIAEISEIGGTCGKAARVLWRNS